jgi:hypothetical protein
MLKRLFIGLATLVVSATVFGQVYKWVDEDGVVHFSDRPHPGAERIQLPTYRVNSRPTPPPVTRSTTSTAQQQQPVEETPAFAYTSVAITSPKAEETLWNIESILNVTLAVTPALQRGHRVRVFMDGTPQMVRGTSFQVADVFRGIHNIQVEILDETGQLMIRSTPSRFYVQHNVIGGG